jgi:hypothetical protein
MGNRAAQSRAQPIADLPARTRRCGSALGPLKNASAAAQRVARFCLNAEAGGSGREERGRESDLNLRGVDDCQCAVLKEYRASVRNNGCGAGRGGPRMAWPLQKSGSDI